MNWQNTDGFYTLGAGGDSTVSTLRPERANFLVSPAPTSLNPNRYRLALEDLSAGSLQGLGVDWDYNDSYWFVNVQDVTLAAGPKVSITAGPSRGANAGEVKVSFKWENCTGAANARIEVSKNGQSVGFGGVPANQAAGTSNDITVLTNSPNSSVTVKVIIQDALGNTIAEVTDTGRTK
ncbi:MAG: hypothetical protein ACRC7O_14560 [Fimbriiglobus sp.]